MSKEKNKNTFRVAALLLVACLISSVMLSGTFAKYTSEYAGQDTALVARWSFTAQGGDSDTALGAVGDNTELALFDHLYDTHINRMHESNYIIAPGVGDEFTIEMNYLADVDADVTIAFETLPNSVAVPIEYSVDNGANWVALNGLAEALANKIIANTDDTATATESAPAANGIFRIAKVDNNVDDAVTISETVKWRWSYDNRSTANWESLYGDINTTVPGNPNYIADADAADTALGVASKNAGTRTSYGIKVTLTATQVAPETILSVTPITAIAAITLVEGNLTAGALTPAEADVAYQWQIGNETGSNYVDITTNGTSSTYTPVVADRGKYIRVVATGTGSYAGTVTSAPFGPIE
jgi:hypothetical protein